MAIFLRSHYKRGWYIRYESEEDGPGEIAASHDSLLRVSREENVIDRHALQLECLTSARIILEQTREYSERLTGNPPLSDRRALNRPAEGSS